MRTHRSLVLRKETLTELRTTELANVGGGQPEPILSRVVCLAEIRNPSDFLAASCDSLFRPCTYGCIS